MMTGSWSRLLGASAMSILLASGAQAQTVPSGPVPAEQGEDADPAVEEIVVTARYRDERLQDVPIAITAFGARQIEDAQIDQVGDFIKLTPNVSIAQSESSGLSQISIRGVTQVRNSEAPVAVVVDGVLQYNARQFAQELFDIESIQVLRGPQGALYGRNATGGAIIINTRQPTNEFVGHVRAGYGSGREYLVEASLSGPIVNDQLLFRAGARYVNRQGYFGNITVGDEQDPFKDLSLRGQLTWRPIDRLQIELRGAVSRTRGGALAFRYQPANLAADGRSLDLANPFDFSRMDADLVDRTFYSTNVGRDVRDIEDISLKAEWDFGVATLTSITALNWFEEFVAGDQVPYTATLNFFGLDGTQTQYIDTKAFSQELRLTSASNRRFRWMVGGYYLDVDRFISTTTGTDTGQGIARVERQPLGPASSNPTASFFADDNRNRDYAGFGNIAYDVIDGLEASVALRYDKETRRQTVSMLNTGGVPGAVNRASFDKWQPKATLSYRPTRDLNLYASYGVGFRSGQFNQNGTAAAAAAAGILGVSDRVPQENTRTYEVGAKLQLANRRVRIDGALFDTSVENQQYFVFIGAIGAQVLVPIDRVSLRGGEVLATWTVSRGFDAYAGFGYTDSEIDRYTVNPALTGNRAPYVPKTTINLGAQYRTALSSALGLFARADYRRMGKQYWDPENSTPRSNVDLFDFRLGLEDPDRRWSIIASVENAFDEVYNSEYVAGGFSHAAPPRVWRIDLRHNF